MKKNGFIFLLFISLAKITYAAPVDYVVNIYDNERLRTFDFTFGTDRIAQQGTASEAILGYGININRQWFTEISGSFYRDGSDAIKFDALYLTNSFLLTHGQSMFDLAFHTDVEFPKNRSEGTSVRFGPALHTDLGNTQLQTNLFFSRAYGAEEPNTMQLSYQLQAKYKMRHELALGVQAFGELGDWNHRSRRDQQTHRVGPVILGSYRLSENEAIRFEFGLLFGVGNKNSSKAVNTRLQYEF